MIHLVLAALLRAGISCVGTCIADIVAKLAVTRHVTCRKSAHLGAVHIEPDTAGHHLDILFGQAGNRTLVTCRSARIACVDTGLNLLLSHHDLLHAQVTSDPSFRYIAAAAVYGRRPYQVPTRNK
jgi:hypothetical protein